ADERGAGGGFEPGCGVPVIPRGGRRGAVPTRVALSATSLSGDRARVVGAQRGRDLWRVPLCDGRRGRPRARTRARVGGAGRGAGANATRGAEPLVEPVRRFVAGLGEDLAQECVEPC